MVFDETKEEEKNKTYIEDVSGEQAIWLKTPNGRYLDHTNI